MPMHRLTSITIGVPNVAETADYYRDFGLIPAQDETVSPYSAKAILPAKNIGSPQDGRPLLAEVDSPTVLDVACAAWRM
jgi:catechol 2,3-dioxygenase-like lactoylglutathione lyase family enzyme